MGEIVILASCKYYFNREHENLVQHLNYNKSFRLMYITNDFKQNYIGLRRLFGFDKMFSVCLFVKISLTTELVWFSFTV